MFKGAELEATLAAYAKQLGGTEEVITNPENEYKQLRLFRWQDDQTDGPSQIFLIEHVGSDPLVIDFLLPEEIAQQMIERYDTAAKSNLLDKQRDVQLVLTGEFDEADLKSFITQSRAQTESPQVI